MNSRIEDIINSNIDSVEYDGTAQSRIEKLLLKLGATDASCWESLPGSSNIDHGVIRYKHANCVINVTGEDIKVKSNATTVVVAIIKKEFRPTVTVIVPTNAVNVIAVVETDGSICLENTTGTLSVSDTYAFSVTYLT